MCRASSTRLLYERRALLTALPFLIGLSACGGSGGSDSPRRRRYRAELILPTDGKRALVPLGLNDGGTAVGYMAEEEWAHDAVPVRVDSGVTQLLAVPAGEVSFASGIQNGGSVVIVGEYRRRPHTWLDGIPQPLEVPARFFSGTAHAISASGRIVGSWADYDDPIPPDPIGPRPCNWASATAPVQALATVDGAWPEGYAWDINDTGQIVGSARSLVGFVAARCQSAAADIETIPHLPGGVLSEAFAINTRGEVAGHTNFDGGESRAWILRAGSSDPERLPSLTAPRPYAWAHDLNSSGCVVGHSTAAEGQRHAVLWQDKAVIDLNTQLDAADTRIAHLDNAVAITESGSIAVLAALTSTLAPRTLGLAVLTPVT